MDRFARLHPAVHFVFFLFTFFFLLSVNNPFFSALSLVAALLYTAVTEKKRIFSSIRLCFVMILLVGTFNFLFAHYGENILFTVGDVEFTLQALFYGLNQGMVLCGFILWFSALSRIFDSEKVMYFLRFAPKSALIFSMVLGFLPRFRNKAQDIRDARLALNNGKRDTTLRGKWRDSIAVLSALVTYSLESSIITARSMNARGYNPRARRPGRYRVSVADVALLLLILAAGGVVIFEKLSGNIVFIFEPIISNERFSVFAVSAFCVMQLLPFVIDVLEDMRWKLSASKI